MPDFNSVYYTYGETNPKGSDNPPDFYIGTNQSVSAEIYKKICLDIFNKDNPGQEIKAEDISDPYNLFDPKDYNTRVIQEVRKNPDKYEIIDSYSPNLYLGKDNQGKDQYVSEDEYINKIMNVSVRGMTQKDAKTYVCSMDQAMILQHSANAYAAFPPEKYLELLPTFSTNNLSVSDKGRTSIGRSPYFNVGDDHYINSDDYLKAVISMEKGNIDKSELENKMQHARGVINENFNGNVYEAYPQNQYGETIKKHVLRDPASYNIFNFKNGFSFDNPPPFLSDSLGQDQRTIIRPNEPHSLKATSTVMSERSQDHQLLNSEDPQSQFSYRRHSLLDSSDQLINANRQPNEDQVVDLLVARMIKFNSEELNKNDKIQTAKVAELHNEVLNIMQVGGCLTSEQTKDIKKSDNYKNSVENITRSLHNKSTARFDTVLKGIAGLTKVIGLEKISTSIINHVEVKKQLRMEKIISKTIKIGENITGNLSPKTNISSKVKDKLKERRSRGKENLR